MAGIRVTLAIDPSKPFFDRVFSRFGEHMKSFEPAFREMATAFYEGERRQFESQGAHATTMWKPLSPRYAAWKARNFPNRGILYRTDRLFNAAIGGPGSVLRITPTTMLIGVAEREVPYARFHQTGTGRMPARPWLVVSESTKRSWGRAISRQLHKAAAEAAQAITAGKGQ